MLSKHRFFYFSLHEFNLPIQVLLHFQSLPPLQSFILRIVLMVLAILLYSNHPVAQTHLKLLNFVLLLAVFKSFSLLRNSGHIHKYYALSRGLCIFFWTTQFLILSFRIHNRLPVPILIPGISEKILLSVMWRILRPSTSFSVTWIKYAIYKVHLKYICKTNYSFCATPTKALHTFVHLLSDEFSAIGILSQ